MTGSSPGYLISTLEVLSALFIFIVGAVVAGLIVLYIVDVVQTKHAIRRNYPIIGHFRYFFEWLGAYFRQYFFAMDREELPFNRAERSWIYRAVKGLDNTVAFGSTRDLRRPGAVVFMNCQFPTLGEDAVPAQPITIGPDCRKPYTTSALFNISAMSYGAISKPAVLALSNGARIAGAWLNTGEGGVSPHHLHGGGDLVFRIGTAKYGVRSDDVELDDGLLGTVAAHDNIKMIELKLSQGAKPGKGGILPGKKVTHEIAQIRGIPMGCDSISPNRHPDIDNIFELLDLLAHMRDVTGKPVEFKTVLGASGWLDELFAEVVRRGDQSAPDFITIDGGDGGTGAAPMSLIDDVGLTLKESLAMLVDALDRYGLRSRTRVVASGKLITPANVVWALCMGADFVASARGNMFALGCIQSLQCNKNTCPTGVTTHDPRLQRGLVPEQKAQRVANYVANINREVGVIAHSCGVEEPRQLRRHHARMILQSGSSASLSDLYPDVSTSV